MPKAGILDLMRTRAVALIVFAACGRFRFDDTIDDTSADATPSPCDATDPSLVACYAFERSFVDSSASHNHGAATGVTFDVGHDGMGARFDAASMMRLPESPSLDLTTAFTIDAWIYLDVVPTGGARSGILDNNQQYGFFVLSNGDARCSALQILVAPAAVPNATWTHLSCTFGGGELAIWRDGVKVGSLPYAGTLDTNGTDGSSIGGNIPDLTNPNPDPLVGVIDSLRVWNAEKPGAEL